MVRSIDNFLNSFTMYRVALYGLLAMTAYSFILSLAGILPYDPVKLFISLNLLGLSCYIANKILSLFFKALTNSESWAITSLILFFLFFPPETNIEYLVIVAGGVFAMASKYILALRKKHIFNPAAVGALVIGYLGASQVGWWVGTDVMLPATLLIGLLTVRKIRKFSMLLSFFASSLIVMLLFGVDLGFSLQETFFQAFTSWPLVFFGTVMLTEPLTMPPTRRLQMLYGALVGGLFSIQKTFGPIVFTPELALIIGNLFAYYFSSKEKLFLNLKEKMKLTPQIYHFSFSSSQKLDFKPGQYLEWTVPHKRPDLRGNRRYFTIASSPTEKDIQLGVRFEQKGSSFKKALLDLDDQRKIVASQLTGDFTLPNDKKKKLVFIAGGIGVTPFRSIAKYLIDKNEKRDIVLFFACSSPTEFIYQEIFDKAKNIGLRTNYVITKKENAPKNWQGIVGYLSPETVREKLPDYKERDYYLSGPISMVEAYKSLLSKLGIPKHRIHTDYFPGF